MKASQFAFPARLVCLGVVLSSLWLASCSGQGDFPDANTESLVSQHLDSRCKLASVLERQPLQPVNGLARVAVRYEADCLPEGGQLARRLRYVMTFGPQEKWYGQEWVKLGNSLESDPLPTTATAGTPAQTSVASTTTEWSEAPECNAVLKRVATEVVPCLASADAQLAAQLGEWLERAKADYRLNGTVSQREAALLQLDQECLHQWKYRNKMLNDEPRLKQCALR